MTDRLQAIAFRIEQKSSKVILMVMRTKPRRTVVPSAVLEPGPMKRTYGLAAHRLEAPVTPRISAGTGR